MQTSSFFSICSEIKKNETIVSFVLLCFVFYFVLLPFLFRLVEEKIKFPFRENAQKQKRTFGFILAIYKKQRVRPIRKKTT